MRKIAATIIFFTRLPLWRWVDVPKSYYSRVVELWPLAGWLTAFVTVAVLFACSYVFPPVIAVIMALVARLLLTGALHEDGLADFCDGFGGGGTRERVLAIMKDSHIGTYGVIGLVIYYLLMVGTLSSMGAWPACLAILSADPWSKWCTSQIVNVLPYARNEETAKNHTVYRRMGTGAWALSLLLGVLPSVFILRREIYPVVAMAVCMMVVGLLLLMLHKRIGGYTGDCCGALALLGELSYYLTMVALMKWP